MAAGAEEVVNWDTDEYVTVNVPNPRSYARVMLPKSLMDADVIIHIPKMKTNAVQVATLGIKGWIGALHNSMRTFIHKNALDNGFSTTDVVKALGSKLKLTLIDGIEGMEGSGPHAGLVCHPKVIVASQDVVAFNAVTCAVMGFHPLEIPATQVAAKDGLGTADMDEIEVLGERIEDVVYPFKRAVNQYVNHYQNVKEFVGGACQGCYWMLPEPSRPCRSEQEVRAGRGRARVDRRRSQQLRRGAPDRDLRLRPEPSTAGIQGACGEGQKDRYPSFLSGLQHRRAPS